MALLASSSISCSAIDAPALVSQLHKTFLPKISCISISIDAPFMSQLQKLFPHKISWSELTATRTDSAVSLRGVPLTLLATEKEEAKAVLTLFLKKQGLGSAAASRTLNKSDLFIDHLVSQLHSIHKSRYLVGLPSVKLSHL